MEMLFEFQILFKLANAVPDLLILALTPVTVAQALWILLPRYLKQFTSLKIIKEFAFILSILIFGT